MSRLIYSAVATQACSRSDFVVTLTMWARFSYGVAYLSGRINFISNQLKEILHSLNVVTVLGYTEFLIWS